jgi:serine/threonine-protein phosphatase PGAM5
MAFQLAEHWNTTVMEKEEEKEPPDQESHDNKLPWYRRYPTLSLERMTSSSVTTSPKDTNGTASNSTEQKDLDNHTLFHGQCLERQLYQPPVPYPAWDYNWDGKMNSHSTLPVLSTAEGLRKSCMTGTTRHILLVRHGQYDEEPLDDRKRCLTPLGRRQAHLTGRRMVSLLQQIEDNEYATLGPIYTSDMLRAKQTASIMAQAMSSSTVLLANPDPDLNEGLPAPMIPPRPDLPGVVEEVDEQKERMERAYRKYFYRADARVLEQPQGVSKEGQGGDIYQISSSGTVSTAATNNHVPFHLRQKPNQLPPPPNHEFDIIVCHGNIIRYFICRALQLPPEAWLRLSVFNCSVSYIIIKPNGYVSCRMIGDIGHLGYKETTFSGAHGLMWS